MATVLFQGNAPEGKKGSPYLDSLTIQIDHALRHIDDRIELNRTPLARLTCVQRLANERYQGHINPRVH